MAIAYDGTTGFRVIENFRPRVAILEIDLSGMNGFVRIRVHRGVRSGDIFRAAQVDDLSRVARTSTASGGSER